jgi:hemerythrin-like domain-containing protein
MASEHDEGRTLLARMAEALAEARAAAPGAPARFRSAATAYIGLLRDHIDKENGVLFPMGDGMLSEAEQTALLTKFDHFEHADMGSGAHERFLDIASGLSERLGVERAPQASAEVHRCCGHGTRCS